MKITMHDVQQWHKEDHPTINMDENVYKAVVSFCDWIEKSKHHKPEQKMEKPEYYDIFKDYSLVDLQKLSEKYNSSISKRKKELLEWNKAADAINYCIGEISNNIEVGDRYKSLISDKIYEVVCIYSKHAWVKSLPDQIQTTLIKSILDQDNYTKLPKDEE